MEEVQRELDCVPDYALLERAVKSAIRGLPYLGDLLAGGHQVVRIAAEDLAIEQSVFLCPIGKLVPSLGADWVEHVLLLKTEVLLP